VKPVLVRPNETYRLNEHIKAPQSGMLEHTKRHRKRIVNYFNETKILTSSSDLKRLCRVAFDSTASLLDSTLPLLVCYIFVICVLNLLVAVYRLQQL